MFLRSFIFGGGGFTFQRVFKNVLETFVLLGRLGGGFLCFGGFLKMFLQGFFAGYFRVCNPIFEEVSRF